MTPTTEKLRVLTNSGGTLGILVVCPWEVNKGWDRVAMKGMGIEGPCFVVRSDCSHEYFYFKPVEEGGYSRISKPSTEFLEWLFYHWDFPK